MNAVTATAPGKVILFGEHAVVYGRPAIAVPVLEVEAAAEVRPAGSGFEIRAVDLGRTFSLHDAPVGDPLAVAVRLTLEALGREPPAVILTIRSTIPVASGLGSGAAVSVAVIRALARYVGAELADETISELAYEVEKIHHGTPSGIDNTVVAFRRPVYYRRGRPIETLRIGRPFQLLIADTGRPSSTKATVAEVRAAWCARPAHYELLFDQIGHLVEAARAAIERGKTEALGPLMNRNQMLLEELDVSSPELQRLIEAALAAGARGAKLSGGGRGGNLIVLVESETLGPVREALAQGGAANVIATRVRGGE
jgi:mevalonate kinase